MDPTTRRPVVIMARADNVKTTKTARIITMAVRGASIHLKASQLKVSKNDLRICRLHLFKRVFSVLIVYPWYVEYRLS